MTDDQILAAAKLVRDGGHWNQLDIINFGRLIAAAEREECARVCRPSDLIDMPDKFERAAINKCAEAIRARGQG
jgi:hypothetical protein